MDVKTIRIFQNNRGSAIASVMVVIMALSVLFTVAMTAYAGKARLINCQVKETRLFYLAEGGVYKKMDELAAGGFSGFGQEEMTLFDDKTVSVTTEAKGGFFSISCTAEQGTHTKTVKALLGQRFPDKMHMAVIAGGGKSALVLAGNARITGDVQVYKDGVKPSKVPGNYFRGKTLVNGAIIGREKPEMPSFDSRLFNSFSEQAKARLADRYSCEEFNGDDLYVDQEVIDRLAGNSIYVQGDVVFGSAIRVKKPLLFVCTGAGIFRDNCHVGGEIEIYASQGLRFRHAAKVENGAFFSLEDIKLEDKTQVRGTMVALTGIKMSGDAVMRQSSVLYCGGKMSGQTLKGSIEILDQAKVSGAVIFNPGTEGHYKKENRVTVEKNAVVEGLVYSATLAMIKGTVNGTVAAGSFYYYQSPTNYYNWIKDAVIDHGEMPEGIALPFMFGDEVEPEIIGWWES